VRVPDKNIAVYVCKKCGSVCGGCCPEHAPKGYVESKDLSRVCCPECDMDGCCELIFLS